MSQYNVQFQDGNGSLAGLRNQIINGGMEISQRGTDGTAVNDGDYPSIDRWAVGGAVRVQQSVSPNAVCPGFSAAAFVTMTAARNWFRQGIELPTTGLPDQFVSGSTWTVSIWATEAVSTAIAFSDGVGFVNIASVVANVAMTNTGETRTAGSYTYSLYTHTFTVAAAPNTTNTCLAVQFSTAFSAAVLFTGAQLEPGPIATPFEQRPIGLELVLCQRYYQRISTIGSVVNAASNTSSFKFLVPLPNPMRLNLPSFATRSGLTTLPLTTGSFSVTSSDATNVQAISDISGCNKVGAIIDLARTATSGQVLLTVIGSNPDTQIDLDAEL